MYVGSLPTASNRATYNQAFQLYDDENNEGIDLTGATIVLEVREPGRWWPALSATNDDGIAITEVATGNFELTFTVEQMRRLCQMTYDVGITVTQNGETTQFLKGDLPVLDGVVR